ncbi:family 16 glycosylhydrolase [Streptomyces sp. NPDC003247]|uniref:family 16 glycosylhydrolase n=1 Tax=Streptomyces sp. NPDC003247 TaxID=3364677 RepID=UPI00367EEB15
MKRRSFNALLGASLLSAASMQLTRPAFAATTSDFPANSTTKSGYTLDFQEEFESSSLDTDKWLPYYLPHWSTRELSAPRYSISDSALALRIDEDQPAWDPVNDGIVKCSSIQTYERNYLHQFNGWDGQMEINHSEPDFNGYTTQFGYFEMRAKGPNCGGGGHTAWWLVGDQADQASDGTGTLRSGEIDIVENAFSNLGSWTPTLHKWTDPSYNKTNTTMTIDGDPANEYHVYGMEWTPTGLEFYYDNEYKGRIAGSPLYPMGMMLGLYTDASWSGSANDTWPKTWYVDYVRVFKPDAGYSVYRLKNRSTGQYMHLQDKTGQVQLATSVPSTYWSGHWYTRTDSSGYTRIRNRWTGDFLNNQTPSGAVQYSHIADKWWSADWVLETNGSYVRIRNRNTGDYLHAENKLGYVEESAAPTTWWSADWSLEATS